MRRLFTLIELIVVIVVIGILATIVIPNISNVKQDALNASIKADNYTIQTVVDLYRMNNQGSLPAIGDVSLETPQPIDYNLIHPSMIRKLPQEGIFAWVDYIDKVHMAYVDAPTNVKIEEGLVTWEEVVGASGYKIYELNNNTTLGQAYNIEKVIGPIEENSFEGESNKKYLISAIDKQGFEIAPAGEGYLGYENYFKVNYPPLNFV